MRNNTAALAARVFLAIVAIAALSALAEFLFTLALENVHPNVRFTGIFALVLFSSMCGILPSWPTPSRISEKSLNRPQRALILAEVTAVVAIAVYVLSMRAYEESVREIALASALSYLFVLVIFTAVRRNSNLANGGIKG